MVLRKQTVKIRTSRSIEDLCAEIKSALTLIVSNAAATLFYPPDGVA